MASKSGDFAELRIDSVQHAMFLITLLISGFAFFPNSKSLYESPFSPVSFSAMNFPVVNNSKNPPLLIGLEAESKGIKELDILKVAIVVIPPTVKILFNKLGLTL